MAYDEGLAERVRELIAAEPGFSEKSMFGGLAFLLDGNMTVAASSQGGLLARLGGDAEAAVLERPHASRAVMRGREMSGWLRVEPQGVADEDDLRWWVERCVEFVRTLPPKGEKK